MATLDLNNDKVDFGLLKPLMQGGPPITQVDAETNAENARAAMQDRTARYGLLQAQQANQLSNQTMQQRNNQDYSIGLLHNKQEQQQYELDVQKFGPVKAKEIQEMRFAEQSNTAQQGLLSAQAKTAQAEAGIAGVQSSKAQQDWNIHNQAMAAYNKVKQSGGSLDDAMTAMQGVIAQNDPDHAVKLASDIETLNQLKKNGKYNDLSKAGDAMWGLNQEAQASGKDPFDVYKEAMSNGLGKDFPGLADAKNYSNPAQFANYQAALMTTAVGAKQYQEQQFGLYAKQYQSQLDTQSKTAIERAKNLTGPNSYTQMRNDVVSSYKAYQADPTNQMKASLYSGAYNKFIKETTPASPLTNAMAPSEPIPQGATQAPSAAGSMFQNAVGSIQNAFTGGSQQPAQGAAPQAQQSPPGMQQGQGQQMPQPNNPFPPEVMQQLQARGHQPVYQNGQVIGIAPIGQ